MKRSSGIILPVFSLYSKYGIGTFGKAAFEFIDFLKNSKQTYWQMLPLTPTGFLDSPYQSFSSFAGNPYFIDLVFLQEKNLISLNTLNSLLCDEEKIDYGHLYNTRFIALRQAYNNEYNNIQTEIEDFKKQNEFWVYDYALFMAVKNHFEGKAWFNWDEDIKFRKEEAMNRYKELLKDEINFYIYIQYLFFTQYKNLKTYAEENKIKIIGDIPIYVSLDSCDVWQNSELFLMNEEGYPDLVSGVPPDYFSKEGQLWGNPLYDWQKHKDTDYAWWKLRLKAATKLYDAIRIDHFRGFESFWAVKSDATTAKDGKWLKGPGEDFIDMLHTHFSDTQIIAEDLGILTKEVRDLLKYSKFYGMRVLNFAFSLEEESSYIIHNLIKECVLYTGTHDNEPLHDWLLSLNEEEAEFVKSYLALKDYEGYNWGVIRNGMMSVADIFIAQLQDYLNAPNSRINTPGTTLDNWSWRMKKEDLSYETAQRIAYLTTLYYRA